MCSGGPGESYIGDPDERALAEWADECRSKQGLVVRPHFPSPNLENPADIVLGKFDALEIRAGGAEVGGPLDVHAVCEYYRYLNCGYRIAAVGGTDKMSAAMPVGASRTYARLDRGRPFDFESWAAAVRAGRTYTTSGPLMDLTVDGHGVGEEIKLTGGGGTVEVHATAECMWPMHRLEVVMNGKVVGDAFEEKGARTLEVRTKVKVDGSSWIAARAASSHKRVHSWSGNLAAHTSPVYIVVPGTELFSPSDATYMLTLIDGGLTYLDTLSVRYDEQRHNAIKAIYRAAQTELHARMHAHGGAHGHNGV